MRTIYKYPIPIRDDFALMMPQGAQVIHFEAQGGEPTIWAIVDTEAIVGMRPFHLAGTGHRLPDGLRHVGSCFHGPSVWHLFEPVVA